MICFKIRIFALRQTSCNLNHGAWRRLWFALKFVSLRLDKHQERAGCCHQCVVICFKIRIFALRQTSKCWKNWNKNMLWFALKFVSLRLDKHRPTSHKLRRNVVICFKIRIFALRQTSYTLITTNIEPLWFALKFVSLRLDKHPNFFLTNFRTVVICFKIRIFALRQTSLQSIYAIHARLWFALKFVSLRLDKHLPNFPNLSSSGCDLL